VAGKAKSSKKVAKSRKSNNTQNVSASAGLSQGQLMDMIAQQNKQLEEMRKLITSNVSAAPAAAPKAKAAPAPAKQPPAPVRRTPIFEPKKITTRKPGVPDIDIPRRTKAINTAEVTKPGGYHRLRYKLKHLSDLYWGDPHKGKKGNKVLTDKQQQRLVDALAEFKGPELGDKTRDLVGDILSRFEKHADLKDNVLKAISQFRKKWA